MFMRCPLATSLQKYVGPWLYTHLFQMGLTIVTQVKGFS
jgi:hypothetical protein